MPTQITGGLSYAFYIGDGVSTSFPLGFEFLQSSHVNVFVDTELQVAGSHYNLTNGEVVFVSPPDGGADIRLVRITPREYDVRAVDFKSFGTITEDQMDLNQRQIWFLIQEAIETDADGNVRPTADYIGWDELQARWTAARNGVNRRLGDLADPELDDEATTKGYVDDIAEWGFAGMPQHWGMTALGSTTNYTLVDGPNLNQNYLIVAVEGVLQTPGVDFFVTPGDPHSTLSFNTPLTAGQNISVQNFGRARFLNSLQLDPNAVATDHLQDFAVTSLKIADAAVITQKLADGAVTTPKLADQAVTTPKLGDQAVTLAKLAGALFSTPLGGSTHRYLRVNKDTGALEVVEIQVDDLSDFLAELANVRITQLATPNTSLNLAGNRLINVGAPSAGTDAATKAWVETQLGSGLGPKVDLLADFTLGGASAWFTPFSGAAPAWLTNSTYLSYEIVLTMPLASAPGAQCATMAVEVEQGGVWRRLATSVSHANTGTTGAVSIRLVNPLSGATYPTVSIGWGFPISSTAPVTGGITGVRVGLGRASLDTSIPGSNLLPGSVTNIANGTVNVPAGSRVLIYGHKALA